MLGPKFYEDIEMGLEWGSMVLQLWHPLTAPSDPSSHPDGVNSSSKKRNRENIMSRVNMPGRFIRMYNKRRKRNDLVERLDRLHLRFMLQSTQVLKVIVFCMICIYNMCETQKNKKLNSHGQSFKKLTWTVLYFNQLLGAARSQKLLETLLNQHIN